MKNKYTCVSVSYAGVEVLYIVDVDVLNDKMTAVLSRTPKGLCAVLTEESHLRSEQRKEEYNDLLLSYIEIMNICHQATCVNFKFYQ